MGHTHRHPDSQHLPFENKQENPGLLYLSCLWESQPPWLGQDGGPCGFPGWERKGNAALSALCSQTKAARWEASPACHSGWEHPLPAILASTAIPTREGQWRLTFAGGRV